MFGRCLKSVALGLFIIFMGSPAFADTLAAQSAATATAGVSTSSTSYTNVVTTPSVSLGADGNVLVVACFSTSTTAGGTANYRLTDGTTSTNDNFGRKMQNASDIASPSLVYLFSGSSGSTYTYSLQHKLLSSGPTITTRGTIVAVPLVTATNNYVLESAVATEDTACPISSTSYTQLSGNTIIESLTLGATGDFYVAATLNCTGASASTVGVWGLEYKLHSSSTWIAIGLKAARSMVATADQAAVKLVASVVNVSPGDYDFRVVCKSNTGATVTSQYINLVAVALANSDVSFDEMWEVDTGVSTTSSTLVPIVTRSGITPPVNTDIFMHVIFDAQTDGRLVSTPAEYDLHAYRESDSSTILDGLNIQRTFSKGGSWASIGVVGLATGFLSGTTYSVETRHQSDGTIELTSDFSAVGFFLNSETNMPRTRCPWEQIRADIDRHPGPGNDLYYDGTDNYVTVPHDTSLDLTTAFTIECWTRPEDLPSSTYQGIIAKGTSDHPVSLFVNGSNVEVWYGSGTGSSQLTSASSLTTCKFSHIAVTYDSAAAKKLVLYINGIEDASSTTAATPPTNSQPLTIGVGTEGGSQRYYTGVIEEVRIWKGVALSETTIRDWMCRKATSSHPNWSNLSAYWRFDENSGTTAYDETANDNDGTLTNMVLDTDRVRSGAPIGDDSAWDYAGSAPSDFSVNLEYPDEGDDMTVTGDGGTWSDSSSPKSGLQVYRVDEEPIPSAPPISWGDNYMLDPYRYWGVFVIGGSSPTYALSYNYKGHQGIIASYLKLAYRTEAIDLVWKDLDATLNTTTTTLTKTGLAGTGFALGGLDSGPDPLAIVLVSFTSAWSDDTTAIHVKWKTATEVDLAGFDVLRADSCDGEYVQVNDALIPAEGGDTWGHTYQYDDRDVTYGRDYWYKLESVDQSDESTMYGPVRSTDEEDSDSNCFIGTLSVLH